MSSCRVELRWRLPRAAAGQVECCSSTSVARRSPSPLTVDQGVVLGAVVDDRHLQVGVVARVVDSRRWGRPAAPARSGDVADLRPGRRSCRASARPSASPGPRCTRTARRGTGAARPSWRRAARGSQPSTSSSNGPATAGSVTRDRAEPNGPPGRSARREAPNVGASSVRAASVQLGRRSLPMKEGRGRSSGGGPCGRVCRSTTSSPRPRPERRGPSRSSTAISRPAVTGYLRLHGAVEPDDLASETFIGVFTGLAGFSGDEGALRAWVFTIAHRRLVDDWRRRSRRPQVADDPGDLADLRRRATSRTTPWSAVRHRRPSTGCAPSCPTTSGPCCSCGSWPTSRSSRSPQVMGRSIGVGQGAPAPRTADPAGPARELPRKSRRHRVPLRALRR